MSEIKFLFVSDPEVGAPIENGEGIIVLDPEGAHYVSALISNELHRSLIFAPEINWYVKHTQDSLQVQKEMLKKLYEMRFIRYRHAPKKTKTLIIDRTVMIIGQSDMALALVQSAQRYFDVSAILPQDVVQLEGQFGNFKAIVRETIEEEGGSSVQEVEVHCAQLVWCDEPSEWCKHRGAESVQDETDHEALLKRIRNRIGFYEYKNTILYDSAQCSYHHNEASTCAKCADICPSFGIVKDDTNKVLHFSALDCIACAKCVGACPTGAIDFAPFSQKAFKEVAECCDGLSILLLAEPYLNAIEGCVLPYGMIPFVVEADPFLSHNHLINLLKESKNALSLYAPDVSEATQEAVNLLNDAWMREEGKRAVYLIQTKEALKAHLALTCKEQNNKDRG